MDIVHLIAFPALLVGAVLLIAGWWHSRTRVPWGVLGIAAGFYLLNLAAQFPVLTGVRAAGVAPVVMAVAVLPLVFGVFEELARWISFGIPGVMRAHRTGAGAVTAGLGHGGAEAVVLLMVYGVVSGSWAGFGLFAATRVLAVVTHIGFATLVVIARRRSLWFLLAAVVAHVAVDASSFAAALVPGPWALVVFGLWAAATIALVVQVHRRGLLRASAAEDRPAGAVPA